MVAPKNIIDEFIGKNRFLSNFYRSPIQCPCCHLTYPTVEHFFQAHKTDHINMRRLIANKQSPTEAKRIGRRVQIREDWEQVKYTIMKEGLALKFPDDPTKGTTQLLIATGDALIIEGNTWGDRIWGATRTNGGRWNGRNLLGIALMDRRSLLQAHLT